MSNITINLTPAEQLMIHWMARDNLAEIQRIKTETPLLAFPDVLNDREATTRSLLEKFPRDSARKDEL